MGSTHTHTHSGRQRGLLLLIPHAENLTQRGTKAEMEQSVSQSVITTLLPTEHMVPTHSDLLYERAMESQHLVVSSGRARTSG